MTTEEIDTFIETMEEFGDVWTVERVKDVYSDKSFKEAINDRKAILAQFGSIIGTLLNR